jgi:hypothetical protein
MLDCDSFKIFAKRKVEALSTVEPPESPNAVTQGPRVLESEECWYGPYEVFSFCPGPTTSRVFCVSSNIRTVIYRLATLYNSNKVDSNPQRPEWRIFLNISICNMFVDNHLQLHR